MSEQTTPAEQKNVWYYRPPTQQVVGVEGPLTGVQLLQRAKEGKIGLNTLVRNPVATKNQWVPAEKIPSLATAIGEAKSAATATAAAAAPSQPTRLPSRPRVPPVPAPIAEPEPVAVVEEVEEVEEVAHNEPINPFSQLRAPSYEAPASEVNPFSPPAIGGHNVRHVGESSKDRYPNLHRYLFAIKTIAFIIMLLALIIGAGFIVASIAIQFVALSFAVLLTGVFTGLLIAGLGYVYYMLALAGTEMMQVIIDIEANTRMRS